MEETPRWLILIYRLPREPSRPRVAVWRKLKDLGALYLQDGVAALPEDAVTREQLEWLQLRIQEADGQASLWEAKPNTAAENNRLVAAFRTSREEAAAGNPPSPHAMCFGLKRAQTRARPCRPPRVTPLPPPLRAATFRWLGQATPAS